MKAITSPQKELELDQVKFIRKMVKEIGSALKNNGFPNFPEGACYDTCIPLIETLRVKYGNEGYEWKLVEGVYIEDEYKLAENPECEEEYGHFWIEISSGWIIDPTAGQFCNEPNNPLVILYEDDEQYFKHEEYVLPFN